MREGEKKKKNGLGKKQRERVLNTVDTLLMDTPIKNTTKDKMAGPKVSIIRSFYCIYPQQTRGSGW